MSIVLRKALQSLAARVAARVAAAARRPITDTLFFDEAVYRLENDDVAQCVDAGAIRSCYDHYLRCGRWEGRRYSVRRWGLSEPLAARLCAAAASLEELLGSVATRLTFGELAGQLRSAAGARVVRPRGPWRSPVDTGPWRAPLPRSGRSRWAMLHLTVAPSVRAPFAFQPLRRDGTAVGEAAALFCKPTRPTQRLVRFPSEAAGVEVVLLQERLRVQPVSVRLMPVPEQVAERRMLRRLVHHHPRYVSRPEHEVEASLRRDAAEVRQPMRDLMWEAYESTFPPPVPCPDYQDWIEQVERPAVEALDREAPDRLQRLASRPLISLLVPIYNPSELALRACLDSVLAQSYPDWELCAVDDASPSPHVRRVLEQYAERDARIRVQHRSENGHICRASNDALTQATGDWVALLDHDDILPRHAFLQVVEAIGAQPEGELFYSDEDKIQDDGSREQPHFKPAWDPDLLLAQNYVGHLLVARTARVREVGGFRPGYEGSQDHDLALRLTEGLSPSQVVHIPRILYHWRMSEHSTAAVSAAKPYTAEAGMAAVQDSLRRTGNHGTVGLTEVPNCYRITRPLPEPAPLVSLIVPTRDAVQLLSTCVDSILEKTAYPSFEVIIVDNGSRAAETLAYLERVGGDGRVVVLREDRPFNFSALNNLAVDRAAGELVALINNDIEVVEEGWLDEMVSNAARPEIGCVGAMLLYPDGTIQHAGVVLGLHGLAGHPYKRLSSSYHGYFGRLRGVHAVSAVTAACLVVKRQIYQEVGGFDEQLAVAFNDVDFCIKVREAGYRNLLVPRAVLVHHESATRGYDHGAQQRRRFVREVDTMKKRWGRLLYQDPCYSPHLSLDHDDYSIRISR